MSSDRTLCRANYEEMGHQEDNTVPEVISDRLLANILWLRDPRLNLPLATIIAANSREHFIEEGVWKRFYATLGTLYGAKKVTDEDIETLFFDNYIEDSLSELTEADVAIIQYSYILEKIEQAKESARKKQVHVTVAAQQEGLEKAQSDVDSMIQRAQERETHSYYTVRSLELDLLSRMKAAATSAAQGEVRRICEEMNAVGLCIGALGAVFFSEPLVFVGTVLLLVLLDLAYFRRWWPWTRIQRVKQLQIRKDQRLYLKTQDPLVHNLDQTDDQ